MQVVCAEVTSISDFNSDLVTGLLQVEGYARAILESGEPPLDHDLPGQARLACGYSASNPDAALVASKQRRPGF